MTVELSAITDSDVPAVAQFLNASLNGRVPVESWQSAMTPPWKVDAPNHGFLLRDGGRIVGVHLALYSQRAVDGSSERFCNLGAWCVLPEYRFQSLRLLKALLAQEGYHFTDLSPSGNVVPLNTRLKFASLDTATALVPLLPWPAWPGRTRISADHEVIEAALAGPELDLYRDHRGAAAANHLLITRGGRSCYVIFRKDRRKNLPLFASILYVSDSQVFGQAVAALTRYLFLHHRVLATLMELRVVGCRPRSSVMLRSPRPKMYRSPRLLPSQIDYLYSELICVPW